MSASSIREHALMALAHEHDVLRVSETGGPNDGPRIREYLLSVGVHQPAPWCMAFLWWAACLSGWDRRDRPGNPASTCTSLAWFRAKGWVTPKVQRGDWIIRCNPQTWSGHAAAVCEVFPGGLVRTIEGNSDDGGSREGKKAVRRFRRVGIGSGWTAVRLGG